jgi:hypothetical protein
MESLSKSKDFFPSLLALVVSVLAVGAAAAGTYLEPQPLVVVTNFHQLLKRRELLVLYRIVVIPSMEQFERNLNSRKVEEREKEKYWGWRNDVRKIDLMMVDDCTKTFDAPTRNTLYYASPCSGKSHFLSSLSHTVRVYDTDFAQTHNPEVALQALLKFMVANGVVPYESYPRLSLSECCSQFERMLLFHDRISQTQQTLNHRREFNMGVFNWMHFLTTSPRECPICLETKRLFPFCVKNAVTHYVCERCVRMGNLIKNGCPICRKTFSNWLTQESQLFGDEVLRLISEEETALLRTVERSIGWLALYSSLPLPISLLYYSFFQSDSFNCSLVRRADRLRSYDGVVFCTPDGWPFPEEFPATSDWYSDLAPLLPVEDPVEREIRINSQWLRDLTREGIEPNPGPNFAERLQGADQRENFVISVVYFLFFVFLTNQLWFTPVPRDGKEAVVLHVQHAIAVVTFLSSAALPWHFGLPLGSRGGYAAAVCLLFSYYCSNYFYIYMWLPTRILPLGFQMLLAPFYEELLKGFGPEAAALFGFLEGCGIMTVHPLVLSPVGLFSGLIFGLLKSALHVFFSRAGNFAGRAGRHLCWNGICFVVQTLFLGMVAFEQLSPAPVNFYPSKTVHLGDGPWRHSDAQFSSGLRLRYDMLTAVYHLVRRVPIQEANNGSLPFEVASGGPEVYQFFMRHTTVVRYSTLPSAWFYGLLGVAVPLSTLGFVACHFFALLIFLVPVWVFYNRNYWLFEVSLTSYLYLWGLATFEDPRDLSLFAAMLIPVIMFLPRIFSLLPGGSFRLSRIFFAHAWVAVLTLQEFPVVGSVIVLLVPPQYLYVPRILQNNPLMIAGAYSPDLYHFGIARRDDDMARYFQWESLQPGVINVFTDLCIYVIRPLCDLFDYDFFAAVHNQADEDNASQRFVLRVDLEVDRWRRDAKGRIFGFRTIGQALEMLYLPGRGRCVGAGKRRSMRSELQWRAVYQPAVAPVVPTARLEIHCEIRVHPTATIFGVDLPLLAPASTKWTERAEAPVGPVSDFYSPMPTAAYVPRSAIELLSSVAMNFLEADLTLGHQAYLQLCSRARVLCLEEAITTGTETDFRNNAAAYVDAVVLAGAARARHQMENVGEGLLSRGVLLHHKK